MHNTHFLVAVIALFTNVQASPTLQKRSFSIQQRAAGAQQDGAWALRKAYLKYGMPLTPALSKRQSPSPVAPAAGPKLTADVIAISETNDLEYLSPVEVGGRMMNLDFDTGSSDLWVFSDQLPPYQQKNHSVYVTNPTSAAANATRNVRAVTGTEKKGFTWKILYGDGTGASGVVFTDKVKIGPVTAPAQAVEAATQISSQFHEERSDGLLGLGFGKSNTVQPEKQKTFFENIKDSLQQPLFTVSLKKNATGTYDFGFIDSKKHEGDVKYVSVNTTRGYWEYQATGYQIGNGPMIRTPFQSIADTGTTLLLLPPQTVKDFYAGVPGAQLVAKEGGWVYPCESAALMPAITLAIADQLTLTVPPTYLDRGKSATGSGLCFGGVQSGSSTLSIWGDVFLKSQFVVFEGGDIPRIGFAKQSIEVVNMGAQPLLLAGAFY